MEPVSDNIENNEVNETVQSNPIVNNKKRKKTKKGVVEATADPAQDISPTEPLGGLATEAPIFAVPAPRIRDDQTQEAKSLSLLSSKSTSLPSPPTSQRESEETSEVKVANPEFIQEIADLLNDTEQSAPVTLSRAMGNLKRTEFFKTMHPIQQLKVFHELHTIWDFMNGTDPGYCLDLVKEKNNRNFIVLTVKMFHKVLAPGIGLSMSTQTFVFPPHSISLLEEHMMKKLEFLTMLIEGKGWQKYVQPKVNTLQPWIVKSPCNCKYQHELEFKEQNIFIGFK